jgi:hypothetical protein
MDVCRTVYGIYYPETRAIVDALWRERPHGWYERNYEKRQDEMHGPCLERWRTWVDQAGVVLGDGFAHEYPTSGASEGIHALMALQAARGKRIHVFDGEYEGYGHVATALGIRVETHARDVERCASELSDAGGDLFWISHPSAIDGNVWPELGAFIRALSLRAPGVRLVVDLTYVGATATEPACDLGEANITAVIWSLSKPFGVYYHRVGGLVSRVDVPTLAGNHWFKNLFSVHLGEKLMAAHGPCDLPRRYKRTQLDALEACRAKKAVDDGARPSDVVMLAHSASKPAAFTEYARGPSLRYCLSPSMDRSINA